MDFSCVPLWLRVVACVLPVLSLIVHCIVIVIKAED